MKKQTTYGATLFRFVIAAALLSAIFALEPSLTRAQENEAVESRSRKKESGAVLASNSEPDSPSESDQKTIRSSSAKSGSPSGGVVNLNTATEVELTRLPGIGPSRAKAILALRARLGGRFRRIEELIRVRGIGRKTFRKLAPMLSLQGPTTLVEASGKKARCACDSKK